MSKSVMMVKDWDNFNDLMEKIININLPTYQEKAEEVKNNLDEGLLEEFLSWFPAGEQGEG